jgi:hypothetical protein
MRKSRVSDCFVADCLGAARPKSIGKRQNDESRPGPLGKRNEGLRLRGGAREIGRRKTAEDLPGLCMRQRTPHCLIKKENCQDGEDNAECSQRQTVKANSVNVGIGFASRLTVVGLSRADRIDVCDVGDVRKRMRRLKDRDERQRQYQD